MNRKENTFVAKRLDVKAMNKITGGKSRPPKGCGDW